MTLSNTSKRALQCFFLMILIGWSTLQAASHPGSPDCEIRADFDPRQAAPITIEFEYLCDSTPSPAVDWSMGDGTFESGNPITHTFTENDSFEVTAEDALGHSASLIVDVPGYLLLDDLEDPAASLDYWNIERGSQWQTIFMGRLTGRVEDDAINTEFTLVVGPSPGTTDSNNGYNGLIIPGPGGGIDPLIFDLGYPQGRIGLDMRFAMDWATIGSEPAPIRFEILQISGTDSWVVAKAAEGEISLRLESETGSSRWVSLGPEVWDTRLEVRLELVGQRPFLKLEWRQPQTGASVRAKLPMPFDTRLIGFSTEDVIPTLLDGTSPATHPQYGLMFADNFEFTQYP